MGEGGMGKRLGWDLLYGYLSGFLWLCLLTDFDFLFISRYTLLSFLHTVAPCLFFVDIH